MLSIIPPSVKGVGATLVTPKPPTFFGIKSAGGGGARRALAALGTNNAKLNMSMAKTQLAISQEVFNKRWNFNPVKGLPLAPGRYQWTSLSSDSIKDITQSPSGNVLRDSNCLNDIKKPALDSSPPFVESASKNLHTESRNKDCHESNSSLSNSGSDQENSENGSISESKCEQNLSSSCDKTAVSKKDLKCGSQKCVTDFFRPQKRKASNHHEECQPIIGRNTPPKKKSRAVH